MKHNFSDVISALGEFVQVVEYNINRSDKSGSEEKPTTKAGVIITSEGLTKTENSSLNTLTIAATIDSSRDDNGFLANMMSTYQSASNTGDRIGSDDTSQQAFTNLRDIHGDVSIIVGHGASGVIGTGDGDSSGTIEQYMEASNRTTWEPYARDGVNGKSLVLFGCNVAEGQVGADFLQMVANTVNKPVSGWTGTVWADGTSVTADGSFLTASPGSTLKAKPSVVKHMSDPNKQSFKIKSGGQYQDVDLNAVKSVHVSVITKGPGCVTKNREFLGEKAAEILREIDFDHPRIETTKKPGAKVTAQLSVKYDNAIRAFNILGTSLLQDTYCPSHYYYISQKLENIFVE
ncbi:DUF4347 domain-containing protein [Marinomonas posidonica]|uniref:DUF4347 domain-containing protein n=1 Tax=Marinomonas posidonica (strain CECT 7376 / NCIMB 14433 / IVIA-Po-181) TaxID=491952 RepID=F6CSJ7_MARPP|nr:DUF4347 domain-containing protein [Marinomonas posidonica]AEF56155.1 hypothetical protein Mar181_3130 [Marinomonas posidonica IVIA-Po-181]